MHAMFVYSLPDSPRYALVKGFVRVWLLENKIPAMYSAIHRGWLVRHERIPDLVAKAEHDGIRVRIKGLAA